MGPLRDYYNTGNDGTQIFSTSSYWYAQIFEASLSYDIGTIKLYLYRNGDPGNITVSIRAAEEWITGWWRPVDADLVSKTISGTSFADTTNTWVEFTFSSPYSLTSGTKYAIVIRQTVSAKLWWLDDGSSPTYANGNYARSTNSGSTWTILISIDFMFETYDSFSPPVDIVTIKKLVAAASNKIYYENL